MYMNIWSLLKWVVDQLSGKGFQSHVQKRLQVQKQETQHLKDSSQTVRFTSVTKYS